MRVVLIAPEIPDYCMEIAEIVAESCDVLLCIADKHFTKERPRSRPRLEVAWLPWPRQREVRNVAFMARLLRRVKKWNPDIVHILNETNIWLNIFVPLLKCAPVITTVHDVQLHPGDTMTGRVPRFFPNLLAKQSDAIIVHGDRLRDEVIGTLSIAPDRIFVAPHPPLKYFFDLAKKNKFTKPNDNVFRVLFYGRIQEYKGLRYLLQAAPLVRAKIPNVRFVIAGAADDFSIYRPYIDDPSIIEVHNRFISEIETARLFTAADLLVLPYIEASQSGVLMIAVPFGLPCVATEVGEMPAVVRSLGIGLVVPPRDSLLLAAKIVEFAADVDLRKQCSENADKAMAGIYSIEALSSQFMGIYRDIRSAWQGERKKQAR